MTALLVLLIANSAYLAGLPGANAFYIANIPLHLVLGIVVSAMLIRQSGRSARVLPLVAAALIGIYLIPAGATTDHYKIVWLHIGLAVAGIAFLKPRWTVSLAALTLVAAGLRFGLPKERIVNAKAVPTSMNEEGEGPRSP